MTVGRCIPSFGVTYEGLKQWEQRLDPSRDLRFGVTYEGLKLLYFHVFSKAFFGFGVTYEGLKPEERSADMNV